MTAGVKATGTVRWFNMDREYGFIHHERADVFVQYSAIEVGTLREGDPVEFELAHGPKGCFARNVRKRDGTA